MAKKVPPTALDLIRANLHAANLTHVAKAVKMSVLQVRKIRDGEADPRWSTVVKLAAHLKVPLA